MSLQPRRQGTLGLPTVEQGAANSNETELIDGPPLLVKVTGYHILNTVIILVFGIWKSVATYRNEAIVSTSLDLVLGVVLAVLLYWLGLYAAVQPPRMTWLFHDDYATYCCGKRPRRRKRNNTQRGFSLQETLAHGPREGSLRRSPPPDPSSSTDTGAHSNSFEHFTGAPRWRRGQAPFANYIDAVVFPSVPRDKQYDYGVRVGSKDLGTRPHYDLEDDGSQKVNFLEYNRGYGIRDDNTISVYVRDPDTHKEYPVARWK